MSKRESFKFIRTLILFAFNLLAAPSGRRSPSWRPFRRAHRVARKKARARRPSSGQAAAPLKRVEFAETPRQFGDWGLPARDLGPSLNAFQF